MVSLFEAGRMELFALPQVRPLMQGANLAVVRLLLHFHLELFYPGVVSVGSVIASVGNRSFTCLQGLFIGDSDGRLTLLVRQSWQGAHHGSHGIRRS